ncbi:MAG TPA: HAD-IA family hydrolase [Thermodesulfobacteriota bacterium]|nr:HAD-IA family hydrolase [Thermodesulfobacteriota bacterium]
MPIKLIIFDLDGTLVNSIADITNSLNYATEPYGFAPKTPEEVAALVGEGITKVIERVLGDERLLLRDEVVRRFLEFYSEHIIDNTSLYPGVRETLNRLNGFKKAIISNKREALSIKVLEGLDLLRFFDLVIGSDSTSEKKPSPVPVLHVLSTLGLGPEDAIMVGDSELDIEAGKRAGVKTVGVTYGYRKRIFLKDADFIINEFEDLLSIVQGMLSIG